MTTQETQKVGVENSPIPQKEEKGAFRDGGARNPREGGRKNPRRGGRADKPRSEFDQKIIDIRRVARVVAGGRRFSFSVALAAGNRKGSVGVGMGKAGDTSLAIDKALKNAKRNMVKVPMTKDLSIPHDVKAKFGSAVVVLRRAPGRGVVAGSSVRIIMELAGIKNVTSKILSGSKNKLNNARATVLALSSFRASRQTAKNTAVPYNG